ncbi:rRNA pseudouridine synthase [Candidatus Uhrbacteria bacterium]|nr:rRNA pseudouridine synthase [Candidatus Uhrbacteria bacterium]
MPIRINKYLADRGIASRRAIDALIIQRRVTVNGSVLDQPGYQVKPPDVVAVDGKRVTRPVPHRRYIVLNKPLNCITTSSDARGRSTVLDYIDIGERVFPIGRLDKQTTGVLLLTNDGELANTLMHPRYSVEKIYRAYLDKPFTKKDRHCFESGIMLDHKKTASCGARYYQGNKRDIIVTLHEGRNRQIHRMFQSLGYSVLRLDRTSYAGLTAGVLQRGEWRELTVNEINGIKQLILTPRQSA